MEHERYSRDNLAGVLRAHGVNPTHQRIEIAYAIFKRGEHLSANDILAEVNRHHLVASRATLYNTLKLLVDSGLIREVIVHPGSVFYDPNTSEHYHLYDVATGRLTDVDASDVRIQGLAKLTPGAVIEGVDMIVRVRRT